MRRLHALPPLALAAALLAGCMPTALPPILDPTPAPQRPAVSEPAERAIAACISRAEAQGLSVTGVDRADPLFGVAAQPTGHNVFLEVGRGGQNFTVRCSHVTASDEARIMTL